MAENNSTPVHTHTRGLKSMTVAVAQPNLLWRNDKRSLIEQAPLALWMQGRNNDTHVVTFTIPLWQELSSAGQSLADRLIFWCLLHVWARIRHLNFFYCLPAKVTRLYKAVCDMKYKSLCGYIIGCMPANIQGLVENPNFSGSSLHVRLKSTDCLFNVWGIYFMRIIH